MVIDNGAYPSPLGYGGFPKSVCTSVNECICHGIPDSRELEVDDALTSIIHFIPRPFFHGCSNSVLIGRMVISSTLMLLYI